MPATKSTSAPKKSAGAARAASSSRTTASAGQGHAPTRKGSAPSARTRAAAALPQPVTARPAKKIDLVREFGAAYTGTRDPALLVLQPATYLTISGKGEFGGAEFQARLGALYGVAFAIKRNHAEAGRDFGIAPLEGQYWGKDQEFKVASPTEWSWKLMVRVPDFVARGDLKRALAARREQGQDALGVKLEQLREGECVQALHVGPYATESETIGRMRAFAAERGLKLIGRHHEIYLSDPRRVPPAKLRTLLRYPVVDA
jgi:hypothetical protein